MEVQSREISLDELAKLAESGYVYAILDACDAPTVPERARAMGEERAVSLYNGTAQEEYWAIAPYLCKADLKVLVWIKELFWKDPWGIIVISKAPFSDLRAHFRRFLMVQSPEGELWYFRFYDPRVLPVFLESSTPEDLKDFFGPVQAFAVHNSAGMTLRLMKAV